MLVLIPYALIRDLIMLFNMFGDCTWRRADATGFRSCGISVSLGVLELHFRQASREATSGNNAGIRSFKKQYHLLSQSFKDRPHKACRNSALQ